MAGSHLLTPNTTNPAYQTSATFLAFQTYLKLSRRISISSCELRNSLCCTTIHHSWHLGSLGWPSCSTALPIYFRVSRRFINRNSCNNQLLLSLFVRAILLRNNSRLLPSPNTVTDILRFWAERLVQRERRSYAIPVSVFMLNSSNARRTNNHVQW
jgi:hypothetical protein